MSGASNIDRVEAPGKRRIARPSLLTALLAETRPITALLAPDGYGKTDILRQLHTRCEEDDIKTVFCGDGDVDASLWFLDNADEVDDDTGGRLIARALETDVRLVIAAARRPRWLGPDLEIRGILARYGVTELAATHAELREVVQGDERLRSIGAEEVGRTTEGWWLGLRALADGGPALARGFDGVAFRYFADAVFAPLPDGDRRTMLLVSLLDDFNAELFEAVTDSARLFDLIDQGQFILPSGGRDDTWRLHPLYARFLRTRAGLLSGEALDEAHRRAADWYARQGHGPAAASHALESGDLAFATRFIDRGARSLIANGLIADAIEWLDRLGADTLRRQPRIATFRAAALILSGRSAEALAGHRDIRRTLEMARLRPKRPEWYDEVVFHLRNQQAMHELIGGVEASRADLDALIAEAEGTMPVVFGEALSLKGMLAVRGGDPVGTSLLDRAAPHLARSRSWYGLIANEVTVAHLAFMAGDTATAERRLLAACATVTGNVGRPVPALAIAHLLLAEIAWDRGDDEVCERYLNQARYALPALNSAAQQARMHLLLARRSLGDGDAASTVIEADAALVVAPASEPLVRAGAVAAKAVALSRAGDPDKAIQVLDANAAPWRLPQPRRSEEGLARLILLVARARVQALLDPAGDRINLAELAAGCRTVSYLRGVVEVMMLQAGARAAACDERAATRMIKEARDVAVAAGLVRVWGDEYGTRVEHLRERLPQQYGTTGRYSGPADDCRLSVGPLTRKELEILRLVAEGLSNQEIADALLVSLPTVKWHVRNILTKLGVKGRVAAIATARSSRMIA